MKTIHVAIFMLLFSFSFSSCDNKSWEEESPTSVETTKRDQKELVNATKLVENFGRLVNVNTKSSHSVKITLDEMKTLKCEQPFTKGMVTQDSVNLYTFILEQDGTTGFAIACGDERVSDVYAYVEDGALSDTIYNKGMAAYIRKIPELCEYDLLYCDADEVLTKCSSPDYYSNEAFGNYQLMQTQWHQSDPYNWGTPGDVCSYYPAGCGVITVAQIVAYYKKCDRNFDFDILKKYPKIYISMSTLFTNEVSEFVKYIGSLCYAEYNCSEDPGTVTYFPNCVNVFKRFGYDYVCDELVKGIDYNKLENCMSKGNVVFAFGKDVNNEKGHMWVIDGYFPLLTKCDATKVHCNWGWGGKADGWYTDYTQMDNYTRPSGTTYHLANYQRYCYLEVKK